MKQTKQLDYWKGEFGNQYIERNSDTALFEKRKSFFKSLLKRHSDVKSILEIGCNIGGNLRILHTLNPSLKLTGIEPNKKAAHRAQQELPFAAIVEKSSLDITWQKKFDLVFTCGVLIHIADNELQETIHTMYNASKKYLLSIEYYARQKETILYRGLSDALFKRPYDQEYLQLYPPLQILEQGFLDKENGFDASTFWLFGK